MSIYKFSVLDTKGNLVSLSSFKGKTLLIVNTATKCSLTPQYDELEELYQTYKDKGLVILDFPSHEFGQSQSSSEIAKFLSEHHRISFPLFDNININGENTHPLYAYLKEQQDDEVSNSKYDVLLELVADMGLTRTGNDIKWNFTKFLINQEGDVVARFAPTVSAKEMEPIIIKELENKQVA